jgi:hypothetical protein
MAPSSGRAPYGAVVGEPPDVNGGQRISEDRLNASIDPIVKAMGRELRRRQTEIDTPEEYARVTALCPAAELRAAFAGKPS